VPDPSRLFGFDCQLTAKTNRMETKQAQPQTPAAAYWQNVATVSIRRLWLSRADAMVRLSIRGWVRTLRQVR